MSRREPDGPGAAGPRAGPGQPGHHRRTARRQARRLRAGRPAVRRHPARGRHPDRVGARAVRRLPPRPRAAAAAADVQRGRGARPGHGRARRPPRRRRPHRPGRQRARQDRARAARAGRRPGRGGPPDHRSRARPRRRPARPGTTTALVQACSEHRRVRLDYRSEAGSEWVVEVEPWAVVVRHGRWYLLCRSPRRTPAGLPGRPGAARRRARRHLRPPADLDPVATARGAPRGRLGVRRRGRHRRARRRVARCRAARPGPARAGRRPDLAG